MVKGKMGVGHGVRWRNLLIAACAGIATLWTSAAYATITQGDFSVFGFFESREAGRWGEGSEVGVSSHATYTTAPTDVFGNKGPGGGSGAVQTSPFPRNPISPQETGGSYDFNHWDLVEMRQLGDIRPDYHIVKNYKLLGRFDTLVLKDADFFAFYRPWYDAVGTVKPHGDAQPDRDWTDYTQKQRQEEFFRNDLREYYGQLNFNDNFSMRVGKQQVIWSEADAYSGTEITNPLDLKYHFIHFESAENLRKNLQMIKFNYILPDFLKTANNEMEAFVIPGDYEGDGAVVNLSDARGPYAIRAANNGPNETYFYNRAGQPYRDNTFADQGEFPNVLIADDLVQDDNELTGGRNGSGASNNFNRTWKESEFGARYSSLLPIGNGLQASFIYLYERRDTRVDVCTSCSGNFFRNPTGNGSIVLVPGVRYLPGFLANGAPPPGDPVPFGTEKIWVSEKTPRHHFFGLTGTYYDKDLTDMVFRYDTFYAPKVGENVTPTHQVGDTRGIRLGGTEGDAIDGSGRWTENTRAILAADRPTYIPWLSKQHTFLVAQYTATWYPDMPGHSINNIANASGKQRRWDDTVFFAATNWLVNGQLTTTNVLLWDVDAIDGFATSTNVYRYSRNILLGVNAQWYLGRSGRFTDIADGIFSRNQRSNELEATFQYEI
jgi:hypothetical protein